MKSKRPFRFWKLLATTLLVVVVLVALFFVALVWNPFEGELRDVRDVVPREVDFYLRKTDLAGDFGGSGGLQIRKGQLPEPAFWAALTKSEAWTDLRQGPMVASARRDLLPQLQQAVEAMATLQDSSGGFLDIARDLIGSEVVIAGYTEDRSKKPAQPLQQPYWCVYARLGWRLRVAYGLLGWSMVQNQIRGQGVEIARDGELLMLRTPRLATPLYLARRLDCLMVGNDKNLLLQSLRLADGAEDEQPFGLSAQYTEGVVDPLGRWAESNRIDHPNALEFSVATVALDPFRRFASTWPDAKNRDSMNERVLATFLNLKGWTSVSGALAFEPGRLSMLGRIVLNSNLHTPFQGSFYRAEKQAREQWLSPFLRMVPDSACAAAALRMPPGEFLHAMYDALLQSEREVLDDSLRRCMFQGQQLADTRDLIERLKIALLPRMGFVFRKNVPDMSRNEQTGELYVPVIARSPVPQVAWVFWLRDLHDPATNRSPADDLVDMLRRYASPVFRFANVYHLPVDGLPEQVTEFANAQIPGTGEIAAIVFRDFLVLSNSGPLIKDILRTRYGFGSLRSIIEQPEFRRIEDELPHALNGFVWLRGDRLLSVLDDYRAASQAQNAEPDPVWESEQRPTAEDAVRRAQYPQYPSMASMPKDLVDGEFNDKVLAYLREQWNKASVGFSAQDLPAIDQLRGLAKLVDAAYLQVELENNYIRFQGKAVTDY
jgi:hypothetical protein